MKRIKLINSFDEDEIGSRMSTNFVEIRENLTVKQAMNELIIPLNKKAVIVGDHSFLPDVSL